MAIIVAVYDANDQLIRVERQDTAGRLISAPLLNPNTLAPNRFQGTVYYEAATLNATSQIAQDIKSSKVLSDAQREAAFAVFNAAHFGDSFAFVRETPLVQQVGDGAVKMPPLIVVFLDP